MRSIFIVFFAQVYVTLAVFLVAVVLLLFVDFKWSNWAFVAALMWAPASVMVRYCNIHIY